MRFYWSDQCTCDRWPGLGWGIPRWLPNWLRVLWMRLDAWAHRCRACERLNREIGGDLSGGG